MSRKLIGNVEPKCAYCKRGTNAADGEHVLCPKMGVLDKNFSCRKFLYDPLKRIPAKPPALGSFTEDDFKL